MNDELEIMLKSHDFLRQEILNSISWQNRFIIAIVPIISALLGLGLSKEKPLELLLVAIPPAVIVFTAFWLTEQSRMMRAGNYLRLLEDEINIKAGGAYMLWENWLRTGMPGGIHTIYQISQYLGIIGMLYVVSGFSIWQIATLSLLPCWVWVLYIVVSVFVLVLVILVIPHRRPPRERRKFKEFKEWKRNYWDEKLQKDISQAPKKAKEVKRETKK